jgi:hypothetical protein
MNHQGMERALPSDKPKSLTMIIDGIGLGIGLGIIP